MKVPFTLESWLKDKSQKIETVDGHSVRIVSTDVKSAERPDRILALVMGDGGYENAIYYNTDGYCLSDSTSYRKKDLVIVTPEPEFTPFEHAFDSALRDYCCDDEKVNSYQEWIKKKAEKLMKIAKKELFTKGVGLYFFNDGHTYFCGVPALEAKEEPPVTAATVKEDKPITDVNENDDWLRQPQVKYDLRKYCPKCGGEMTCDKNVIYTSYPPKYKYTCHGCGNVEYVDMDISRVIKHIEDSAYCGEGQTVTSEPELTELEQKAGNESYYDEFMDNECIKLCDILNSIPSIDTFESCCGHLKDRYSIWFFCKDIITISRLGRCVERNYSDGKWELLVDSTDTHPTGVLWLRSKVPFESYNDMEKSVNGLCKCIQYWFNPEFDSYFNGNTCK